MFQVKDLVYLSDVQEENFLKVTSQEMYRTNKIHTAMLYNFVSTYFLHIVNRTTTRFVFFSSYKTYPQPHCSDLVYQIDWMSIRCTPALVGLLCLPFLKTPALEQVEMFDFLSVEGHILCINELEHFIWEKPFIFGVSTKSINYCGSYRAYGI